jgi:hypothetical protein
MNDMGIDFSSEDWQRIRHDYTAWWNHELDRPLISFYVRKPVPAEYKPAPWLPAHLPKEWSAQQVVDLYTADLQTFQFGGDAFPYWGPNFGPGSAAAFLNLAELKTDENTVWFEPEVVRELSELQIRFDSENFWWKRVLDLSAEAARRWKAQVCVGYTDIGGNLDILASARTTNHLLMDAVDEPGELDRLTRELTKVWLRYHAKQSTVVQHAGTGYSSWGRIWAPEPTYMLQSDFSYMISPQMFEQFVMPDLKTCCERIPYSFYHMDGKGELPHLDLLCSLEKLRGIQWIPGDAQRPPENWPEILKKIRTAGKLCQVFTTVKGARKILDEQDGGRGFHIRINDPSVHEGNLKCVLDSLQTR